jgi:hypothetical protein
MMKSYRILAQPDLRLAAHGVTEPQLSERLLNDAIADLRLRGLSKIAVGRAHLDFQLRRPSDAEALDEAVAALERLGFVVVEAVVTEWVSAATQRALIASAGFIFGAGAAESPIVGLGTGAAATLAAELAGVVADRAVAEYLATRDHGGAWSFGEVPQRAASRTLPEPGFSPA